MQHCSNGIMIVVEVIVGVCVSVDVDDQQMKQAKVKQRLFLSGPIFIIQTSASRQFSDMTSPRPWTSKPVFGLVVDGTPRRKARRSATVDMWPTPLSLVQQGPS